MNQTKIDWCDTTWNPVTGCSSVSEGCDHCYAERMSVRLRGRCGYPADEPFRVTLHPDRLNQPLRTKKPKRIFVCSMGDLFHPDVPFDFIAAMYGVMAVCRHTFLVLTKRPQRALEWYRWIDSFQKAWLLCRVKMLSYLNPPNDDFGPQTRTPWPLPNVMVGVTAENQARADERIPVIEQIPSAKTFVSIEPMLDPVDLSRWLVRFRCIDCGNETLHTPDACDRCESVAAGHQYFSPVFDWVIVGGETGPRARPMHPDWVYSILDQCAESAVPFFFKSWGAWGMRGPGPHGEDYGVRVKLDTDGRNCSTDQVIHGVPGNGSGENPVWMGKFGKKHTGDKINGKTWKQWPRE